MEPVEAESLVSRVERSLWTIWGVISEAVNRLLRPNNIGSDLNTPVSSHAETNDSSEEETIVEKCLDVPNSSKLLDLTSVDREESEEKKTLQSHSNKTCEEIESTKAETLHHNKQDYEGLLITRNTNIEEPETPKNDTYKHLKTKSLSCIEDTVCIKVEGNKFDTYAEEMMSPVNADIFKETDQEQDQMQDTERENFRDNEARIKLMQRFVLEEKTGIINMGDSGKEPDGANVMQDGSEDKEWVGQKASEDAKESEDSSAESEDEMIIHLQTYTTETHGIPPVEDFSCEDNNSDSLVDVLLEGAGRKEVNRNLEKTPKGISEGRGVALKERNIPTCEETRAGVPVNNNELSLDDNTTQHFLEVDSKEAEAARLPEEVESHNHWESLQNTDQEYLLPWKAVEEKQDNTLDTGNVVDLLSYTEIQPVQASIHAENQDPGLYNQETENESLENSMKKEIRYYSSDSGVVVAIINKTIDTPELQDVMDEAEPNIKPFNPPNDENGTTSVITGKSPEEFRERVDKLLKFGEENMTETHLEEFVGNNENQNTSKTESEIAFQLQAQEQSSSRALEIKALDVINGADERKKDTSKAGMSTEETDKHVIQSSESLKVENSHSISESQDVIDEEILDLWLEAVTPSAESISKDVSEVETPKGAGLHLLVKGSGIETGSYFESRVRQPEEDHLHQETRLAQRRIEEEWEETSTESISKEVPEVETPKEEGPLVLEGIEVVYYAESKDRPPEMDYLYQEDNLTQRRTAESAETERGFPEHFDEHPEVEQSRKEPKDWFEEQYDKEPRTDKLTFQAFSQKETQPEQSGDFQERMPISFEFANIINVAEDTDERKLDASEAGMSTEETDKHVIQSLGSLVGENSHSISGSGDVIHEELLDLWLEAMMPSTESISKEASEVESPKGVGPQLLEGIEAGSHTESKLRPPKEDYLNQEDLVQRRTEEECAHSAEIESGYQEHYDEGRMNTDIILLVNTTPLIPVDMLKVKDLQENVCSFLEKTKLAEVEQSRNRPKDLLKERYDEEPSTRKLPFQASSPKEQQPEQSEDFQELMPISFEFAEVPTTKCKGQTQVDSYLLDISLQKCRITVKNPRVRPPTNPRTLLHTPSMMPTPSSQAVPLGAVSIGIKLPGLGASLPVLKKAGKVTGMENGQKTLQKADKETKPEDNIDSPKQEEAQNKPRWTPPKQQGFGNPLMLELKTKLKRTANE